MQGDYTSAPLSVSVFKRKIHSSKTIYTTEIKFHVCVVNDGNTMVMERKSSHTPKSAVSNLIKTSGQMIMFIDV